MPSTDTWRRTGLIIRSGSELLRDLCPRYFIFIFSGLVLELAGPGIAGVWDILGGWVLLGSNLTIKRPGIYRREVQALQEQHSYYHSSCWLA